MEKIVGMVGLGLMGSALSDNLLKTGYRVLGCDPDGERAREFQERGGTPVGSPAEAAGGAPVVVLSLPHSGIVREACLGEKGLAGGAGKGTLVIDTTTARPEDSAEIAAELENRGMAFLDASLSGTSKMAWSRDLVAMVGGRAEDFERAQPVLNAIARKSYYLGPGGTGARTKLIVNLVLGLNRLALAEGLVLGMKAGMDMDILLAVLKDGAAYSKGMDQKGEKMIRADYRPEARIRQHHKDVRLMLEQGQRFGAPMFLTSVMDQILQTAEAGGLSDMDNSTVIEVLRRFAGIPAAEDATPSRGGTHD